MHERRPGEALIGCECGPCNSLRDEAHYGHVAAILGLTDEEDQTNDRHDSSKG